MVIFFCKGILFDLRDEINDLKGWENAKRQILITTPRRWGKTYCTAMFVVAYMLCVPNKVQVIFSTSGRISRMFLETVYAFLIPFINPKRICKATTEALWIYTEDGSISKVFSYPSNPKIYHAKEKKIFLKEK